MSRVREAAPLAVVAVLCAGLALYAELDRAAPPRASTRAPVIEPRAVELLDGLQVGERIAGWNVVELAGPHERAIDVVLERDGQRFTVTVAPMGARLENPALQTERYAIYYGHPVPADRKIPDGAVRAITAGIARRVAKHEIEIAEP